MSVSSISNHSVYLPNLSTQADTNTPSNSGKASEFVQISDHAKHLLSKQNQVDLLDQNEEEQGKETVQITSSIGRLSRVTGLQREEVADLYRSIDKLT